MEASILIVALAWITGSIVEGEKRNGLDITFYYDKTCLKLDEKCTQSSVCCVSNKTNLTKRSLSGPITRCGAVDASPVCCLAVPPIKISDNPAYVPGEGGYLHNRLNKFVRCKVPGEKQDPDLNTKGARCCEDQGEKCGMFKQKRTCCIAAGSKTKCQPYYERPSGYLGSLFTGCCDDAKCVKGKCVDCGSEGDDCEFGKKPDPCCRFFNCKKRSSKPKDGVCRSCKLMDASCDATSECCRGLRCQGRCKPCKMGSERCNPNDPEKCGFFMRKRTCCLAAGAKARCQSDYERFSGGYGSLFTGCCDDAKCVKGKCVDCGSDGDNCELGRGKKDTCCRFFKCRKRSSKSQPGDGVCKRCKLADSRYDSNSECCRELLCQKGKCQTCKREGIKCNPNDGNNGSCCPGRKCVGNKFLEQYDCRVV